MLVFLLSHAYYSTSVVEGESDIVITRLITEDADTNENNTDSIVHLVSAIGVTNNMDGKLYFIGECVYQWEKMKYYISHVHMIYIL